MISERSSKDYFADFLNFLHEEDGAIDKEPPKEWDRRRELFERCKKCDEQTSIELPKWNIKFGWKNLPDHYIEHARMEYYFKCVKPRYDKGLERYDIKREQPWSQAFIKSKRSNEDGYIQFIDPIVKTLKSIIQKHERGESDDSNELDETESEDEKAEMSSYDRNYATNLASSESEYERMGDSSSSGDTDSPAQSTDDSDEISQFSRNLNNSPEKSERDIRRYRAPAPNPCNRKNAKDKCIVKYVETRFCRKFDTPRKARNHYILYHTKYMTNDCRNCDRKFFTEEHLQAHDCDAPLDAYLEDGGPRFSTTLEDKNRSCRVIDRKHKKLRKNNSSSTSTKRKRRRRVILSESSSDDMMNGGLSVRHSEELEDDMKKREEEEALLDAQADSELQGLLAKATIKFASEKSHKSSNTSTIASDVSLDCNGNIGRKKKRSRSQYPSNLHPVGEVEVDPRLSSIIICPICLRNYNYPKNEFKIRHFDECLKKEQKSIDSYTRSFQST